MLDENIARLAALVGLSEVDRQILGFALLLTMTAELTDACRDLGEMTSTGVMRASAAILHIRPEQASPLSGLRVCSHVRGSYLSIRNGA